MDQIRIIDALIKLQGTLAGRTIRALSFGTSGRSPWIDALLDNGYQVVFFDAARAEVKPPRNGRDKPCHRG
jgi:hypothetical protein